MFKTATIACLLGTLVLAYAADQKDQKPPVQADTRKEPAKAAPQPAKGGMVVVVDPATGQIKAPTPAEIGTAIGPSPQADTLPIALPTIQGPGGAIGLKLPDSSLMYTVVTRTPEGKLASDCVQGDQAAVSKVTAGEASKSGEAKPKAANVK